MARAREVVELVHKVSVTAGGVEVNQQLECGDRSYDRARFENPRPSIFARWPHGTKEHLLTVTLVREAAALGLAAGERTAAVTRGAAGRRIREIEFAFVVADLAVEHH